MRVLVLAKEGEQSGSPTPPTAEAMAEFQKFNEELVKAGGVLGSGRLYPSSQGKRGRFDGKKRTVIDGPFAETKELVGGYWLWQVRSGGDGVAGREPGTCARPTCVLDAGVGRAGEAADGPPHARDPAT